MAPISVRLYSRRRQILIDPRDQDYQRIFWRSELSAPIEEYHLCTVTYGTASAISGLTSNEPTRR